MKYYKKYILALTVLTNNSGMQSQVAVTAYWKSKRLMLFDFAEQIDITL